MAGPEGASENGPGEGASEERTESPRPEAPSVVLLAVGRDRGLYDALDDANLYEDDIELKVAAVTPPKPGKDRTWEDVQRRLKKAAGILVSLSPAFLASWFMAQENGEALARELSAARRRGRPVFLLITEPVSLPASLRAFDVLNSRLYNPVRSMSESERAAFFSMLRHEIGSRIKRASCKRDEAFEEFKLLFESTQHLSDKRQGAAQIYLAVAAGITAVLAFLIKDLSYRGWPLVVVSAPLFLAGFAACIIWENVILRYELKIDWRYRQLREIESQALASGFQTIKKEWDALYRPHAGKGLSRLEVLVPLMFKVLFIVGFLLVIGLAAYNEIVGPAAGGQPRQDAPTTGGEAPPSQ
jgi:hypothetical protein